MGAENVFRSTILYFVGSTAIVPEIDLYVKGTGQFPLSRPRGPALRSLSAGGYGGGGCKVAFLVSPGLAGAVVEVSPPDAGIVLLSD